jgi:hypothetical protein
MKSGHHMREHAPETGLDITLDDPFAIRELVRLAVLGFITVAVLHEYQHGTLRQMLGILKKEPVPELQHLDHMNIPLF